MADKQKQPEKKTEEVKALKQLEPGQVKGPYQKGNLWYYETVELGESCGFTDKDQAETNIEGYTAWFKNRK